MKSFEKCGKKKQGAIFFSSQGRKRKKESLEGEP
jgi:hypothetical protein